MSWIDEIREDISGIGSSANELKKFGLTVGGIFVVLGAAGHWMDWWNIWIVSGVVFIGLALSIVGIFSPSALRRIHHYWMGVAIVIGSIVSRIILFILYFSIVTVIALVAKLTGKKFFAAYKDERSSYWIHRDSSKKIDYERMS